MSQDYENPPEGTEEEPSELTGSAEEAVSVSGKREEPAIVPGTDEGTFRELTPGEYYEDDIDQVIDQPERPDFTDEG